MRDIKNIKFRGKVKDNSFTTEMTGKPNDWVYGNLIVSDNGDCFITTWEKSESAGYKSKIYQVHPKTVGQYTGLRDNKKTAVYPEGQEIYDGDLFYYHGVLRKVVYREDNTSWMGVVVKGNIGSCNFYLRDITDDYEVRLNAEIIDEESFTHVGENPRASDE